MQATAIPTRGVVDTLDAVSRLHAVRADAEAAVCSSWRRRSRTSTLGDRCRRSRRVLPGMERSVQVGGAGTPRIAEFAYAELGARMQMAPWSAKRYVADALDVRHRLPLIWARVVAARRGSGTPGWSRPGPGTSRWRPPRSWTRRWWTFVDGSLPWGRFEARLAGKVVAADPETAAEREEAGGRRAVRATDPVQSEQGTAGFYVRSTVGVIARIEATVAFLADALAAFGDSDAEDLRRVKAMVVLANPVQGGRAAGRVRRAAGPDRRRARSMGSPPGARPRPGSTGRTDEPADGTR